MKTQFFFVCVLGALIIEAHGQTHNQDDSEEFADPCTCDDEQYQPVCGDNGQTYSNACEATCKSVALQCEGECPCSGSPSDVPTRSQKVCPFLIKKVCGDNGTTFDNECEAENNGVSVQCEGECPCSEKQDGNQEENLNASCPPCCTNRTPDCSGKRVDCSRCNN